MVPYDGQPRPAEAMSVWSDNCDHMLSPERESPREGEARQDIGVEAPWPS